MDVVQGLGEPYWGVGVGWGCVCERVGSLQAAPILGPFSVGGHTGSFLRVLEREEGEKESNRAGQRIVGKVLALHMLIQGGVPKTPSGF